MLKIYRSNFKTKLERIGGIARVGIEGFVENTAHTASIVGSSLSLATVAVLRVDSHAARFALRIASNADVTFLTIRSGPRVADDPVSTESVFTVADHLDSVVERGGAINAVGAGVGVAAASEDASFVVGPVGSITRNGERAGEGEGVHDGTGVVGLDGNVAFSPNFGEILPELALVVGSHVGKVRIGPFLVQSGKITDGVDTELNNSTSTSAGTTAIIGVGGA